MTTRIKILFDAGPLVNGPRTGVGKYTLGIIQSLADDYPDSIELVGHYFDFLGRKSITHMPTAPNIRYRTTRLIPGKVFNMLRRLGFWIPFELLVKERGDFHFFPGFVGWPSLFHTPSTSMVHDLTYLEFPQYVNGPARFDLRSLMPGVIRRASFLMTNSKVCEQGLREAYAIGNRPILVENIPPVDVAMVSQTEAAAAVKKLGIAQDYILSFGTLEPRKNLVGLLQAYDNLPAAVRDTYALVLGGGKGWYDSEIKQALQAMLEKGRNIYQTGYVSDQVRAALYQKAAVYVLPSFYEGFGMQIMEAMSYRVPMLLSDIPVLHESAEDAALYCDPNSVEDITRTLAKILSEKSLRKKLVDRGEARLKLYSWHKVTKDMFEQISSVLNK